MRKFALLAVAVALTAGTAAYSLACDHDKASSASASAAKCPYASSASNTQLAGAGGSCCTRGASKSAAAGSACAELKNGDATSAAECKDSDCADAVFSIADIHGDCCVDRVQTALSHVKNVRYVNVDVAEKKAYVCTRGAKLDRKAAIKSLKSAGYAQVVYVGMDKTHMMREASKSAKASPASKV